VSGAVGAASGKEGVLQEPPSSEASETGSWHGGKNRHAEQETQEAAASESGSWKIHLLESET